MVGAGLGVRMTRTAVGCGEAGRMRNLSGGSGTGLGGLQERVEGCSGNPQGGDMVLMGRGGKQQ